MLPTSHDSSVVSPRLTSAVVAAIFTLSLVVCAASFVAMAVGDPELIALIACGGVAVLLVCYAILAVTTRRQERGGAPTAP